MLPVKFYWFKITSKYKLISKYIALSLICLTAQVWQRDSKNMTFFLSAEKYPMETIPDVFSDWVTFYLKNQTFWEGMSRTFQLLVFWHEGSRFLTWREIEKLSKGMTNLYLKKCHPDKTYAMNIASEHKTTIALTVTHMILYVVQRLPS